LLLVLLDIASWIAIYGTISYLRRAAFYVTPFEFAIIDLLQLAVIGQGLYIVGGYDRHTETRSLSYTTEHILALVVAAAFSSLLIYSAATFDKSIKPSRGVLLASFILFTPVSLGYRRWIRSLVTATTARRVFLVIGGGPAAARFYQSYQSAPNRQQLHFVDIGEKHVGQPVAGPGSPIVEGNLAHKIRELSHFYSGIIVAEDVKNLSVSILDMLVRTQFQRTRVYTLESFYESHWRYVPLDAIDPMWPLQAGFQLARISPYHYLKRLFDLSMSSAGLLICVPLGVLIGILIWLLDGSPIFFKQSRVGREGRAFTIYKFRTMLLSSDTETEDIYTRKDDPRVTRLGRWLRKLRLDELPQLWNVLTGEMSLIGPRAEWSKCAERYEEKVPFYHFRHLVKPGITGWAQVNYPYGESDEDAIEKLEYDLYYIRYYSLKLDAMIVLKTVHVMLFGKGR